MIINQNSLLGAAPIKNMLRTKEKAHGVSHGLSEAGLDIRIKQEIVFTPRKRFGDVDLITRDGVPTSGRFTIASAIEEFQMPPYLVGIVHDKSTWARKGLSVFNTVIEPGFIGGLTLELVYHGSKELIIPAGSGIAQILFHQITNEASYKSKYQFQSTDPTPAIKSID